MPSWMNEFIEKECTPAYIFDIEKLLRRVERIKSLLSRSSERDCSLCYAMKANPFLIKVLEKHVDHFEVCSFGELAICMDQKVDMGKVVFSGVVKRKNEISQAISSGVSILTIESIRQLEMIRMCAAESGKKVSVLLRVTSGNQFGMDWEVVKRIISERDVTPELDIKGIQFFSGTQKKKQKILSEVQQLNDYEKQLREAGFSIDILEYGPGLSVDYFGKEEEDLEEQLQEFGEALCRLRSDVKIVLEMGRFLAADCGYYLSKVVDLKESEEQKYCLIDGGINHVNYYGQVMGARRPPVRHYRVENDVFREVIADMETEQRNLCGALCTVADVLVRNLETAPLRLGDYFLFEKIGAYSVTEGMYLFLSRDLPKIFFWRDEKLVLVRESYGTYQWNCVK